jgi:hypothetical protein
MATLTRLSKSKLTMYAGDHNPPHFHVLANDGSEALILRTAVEPARKLGYSALAWVCGDLAQSPNG